MRDKNEWRGIKCYSCDQRYDESYHTDKYFALNTCHESLQGARVWYCGKCNFDEKQKQIEKAQEAAKESGGAFAKLK